MTRSDQDITTARLSFFASENKSSGSKFLVGRNAKGALISIRRPCRHKSHKIPNGLIHLDTELEPNKSSGAESLQSRRLWPVHFAWELHRVGSFTRYRDRLTLPLNPEMEPTVKFLAPFLIAQDRQGQDKTANCRLPRRTTALNIICMSEWMSKCNLKARTASSSYRPFTSGHSGASFLSPQATWLLFGCLRVALVWVWFSMPGSHES